MQTALGVQLGRGFPLRIPLADTVRFRPFLDNAEVGLFLASVAEHRWPIVTLAIVATNSALIEETHGLLQGSELTQLVRELFAKKLQKNPPARTKGHKEDAHRAGVNGEPFGNGWTRALPAH